MDKRLDASKLSFDALKEAALRYLDRSDASVEQLRRVLRRRVERAESEALRQEAQRTVEVVLARLTDARLLDDARYALAFAMGQRRRGTSSLGLRAKMAARGLGSEHVEAAISATLADDEHNEEQSALIYAHKRKLARLDLGDLKQRQKALSSLARRGFSFDVAKRVLEQIQRARTDEGDA